MHKSVQGTVKDLVKMHICVMHYLQAKAAGKPLLHIRKASQRGASPRV